MGTPATPPTQPVVMPNWEDSQIDSIFPWLVDTPYHYGPFSSPERCARWAAWLVALVASIQGLYVATLLLSAGDPRHFDGKHTTVPGYMMGLIAVVLPLTFLASGVAVIMWQRTVIRNTRYFGCSRPHPGPTLAAFSWIIPFANFYYPFKSVQEAARYGAEDRRDIRGELAWWWTTWILGTATNRIAIVMARSIESEGDLQTFLVVDGIGSLCLVISGVLLIRIILEVSARHIRRHRELDAAEVFG